MHDEKKSEKSFLPSINIRKIPLISGVLFPGLPVPYLFIVMQSLPYWLMTQNYIPTWSHVCCGTKVSSVILNIFKTIQTAKGTLSDWCIMGDSKKKKKKLLYSAWKYLKFHLNHITSIVFSSLLCNLIWFQKPFKQQKVPFQTDAWWYIGKVALPAHTIWDSTWYLRRVSCFSSIPDRWLRIWCLSKVKFAMSWPKQPSQIDAWWEIVK